MTENTSAAYPARSKWRNAGPGDIRVGRRVFAYYASPDVSPKSVGTIVSEPDNDGWFDIELDYGGRAYANHDRVAVLPEPVPVPAGLDAEPSPAEVIAALVMSPFGTGRPLTLAELVEINDHHGRPSGVFARLSSGEQTLVEIASALRWRRSGAMPSLARVTDLDAATRRVVAEQLVRVIAENA